MRSRGWGRIHLLELKKNTTFAQSGCYRRHVGQCRSSVVGSHHGIGRHRLSSRWYSLQETREHFLKIQEMYYFHKKFTEESLYMNDSGFRKCTFTTLVATELRTPNLNHLSINLKSVQTGKVWVAPISYNLGNQVVERPVGITAANKECLTGRTWKSIEGYGR